MNSFALVPATRGALAYLDIEIDGKALSHHFAGRLGAHPPQISAVGWKSASIEAQASVVSQLLGEKPSELPSGRVPVLVCEECGHVGCGAFVVRLIHDSESVRWADWSYENGYEPAEPIGWPTKPSEFVFDRASYENELRRAL